MFSQAATPYCCSTLVIQMQKQGLKAYVLKLCFDASGGYFLAHRGLAYVGQQHSKFPLSILKLPGNESTFHCVPSTLNQYTSAHFRENC